MFNFSTELYYGGEGVSVEQPQSLTCPYCTRMGFTEATLQEHVAADHPDTSFEVVSTKKMDNFKLLNPSFVCSCLIISEAKNFMSKILLFYIEIRRHLCDISRC